MSAEAPTDAAANKEAPVTPNGTKSEESAVPELNIERLHSLPSEQQDLYLLTYTSDLARHVAALDASASTAQQTALKKELFKVISLSSPTPTRVIRNNVASCFLALLSKGERKILFSTITDLVEQQPY